MRAIASNGRGGARSSVRESLQGLVKVVTVFCAIAGVLTLLSLLFGIFPDLFFRFFKLAGGVAASIFGGPA